MRSSLALEHRDPRGGRASRTWPTGRSRRRSSSAPASGSERSIAQATIQPSSRALNGAAVAVGDHLEAGDAADRLARRLRARRARACASSCRASSRSPRSRSPAPTPASAISAASDEQREGADEGVCWSTGHRISWNTGSAARVSVPPAMRSLGRLAAGGRFPRRACNRGNRARARVPGGIKAVDGVDLEVAEGEIYAFLGPNGAGKTTTVRMLTTLLRPTGGSARVAGHDVVERGRPTCAARSASPSRRRRSTR